MKAVQDGDLADPAKVAQDGYEALMAGEASVVSGVENKIKDQLGDLMPDTLRAQQAKKEHEPTEPKKAA